MKFKFVWYMLMSLLAHLWPLSFFACLIIFVDQYSFENRTRGFVLFCFFPSFLKAWEKLFSIFLTLDFFRTFFGIIIKYSSHFSKKKKKKKYIYIYIYIYLKKRVVIEKKFLYIRKTPFKGLLISSLLFYGNITHEKG